jgi:hypothetical protein
MSWTWRGEISATNSRARAANTFRPNQNTVQFAVAGKWRRRITADRRQSPVKVAMRQNAVESCNGLANEVQQQLSRAASTVAFSNKAPAQRTTRLGRPRPTPCHQPVVLAEFPCATGRGPDRSRDTRYLLLSILDEIALELFPVTYTPSKTSIYTISIGVTPTIH